MPQINEMTSFVDTYSPGRSYLRTTNLQEHGSDVPCTMKIQTKELLSARDVHDLKNQGYRDRIRGGQTYWSGKDKARERIIKKTSHADLHRLQNNCIPLKLPPTRSDFEGRGKLMCTITNNANQSRAHAPTVTWWNNNEMPVHDIQHPFQRNKYVETTTDNSSPYLSGSRTASEVPRQPPPPYDGT